MQMLSILLLEFLNGRQSIIFPGLDLDGGNVMAAADLAFCSQKINPSEKACFFPLRSYDSQMKPGSNRPSIHPRTRHKNRIKSLLRVKEIRYRSHLDQA